MSTVTKKELIDTIAESTKEKRVVVKKIVQSFLDNIILELGKGNRLEFRDFGVFEVKSRKARKAQNPKTLEPVQVPPKRTVKFKVGRLMKQTLAEPEPAPAESPQPQSPQLPQLSTSPIQPTQPPTSPNANTPHTPGEPSVDSHATPANQPGPPNPSNDGD